MAEITGVVVSDQRVRRLLTNPGWVWLTAAALVAVIGDIQRFDRPNQLVGYLGLDPRVRQSGDQPFRTAHISHQGKAHARGLLEHHGLDLAPHLVPAVTRRVRPVRQSFQALLLIPGQPGVDRLPAHPHRAATSETVLPTLITAKIAWYLCSGTLISLM